MHFVVLFFITPALAFLAYQQLIVVPRLRRELVELNARRAETVRKALAHSLPSAWSPPIASTQQDFLRWVQLNNDGTITVGDKQISLKESSHAVARDARHIPRATVITRGNGEAFIESHGNKFIARFQHGEWSVQPTSLSNRHET